MQRNLHVLGNLLGCYFHQDWTEEFDSDQSALQSIVESEPEDQRLAGALEIDTLLFEPLSEQELQAIVVDELGCYFEPASQGMTYSQWLKKVRDVFSR